MKKDGKVERVTTRLDGELGRMISETMQITTASSGSEVVRRAISVYHRLAMEKLKGNDPIILTTEDGVQKAKPIFLQGKGIKH